MKRPFPILILLLFSLIGWTNAQNPLEVDPDEGFRDQFLEGTKNPDRLVKAVALRFFWKDRNKTTRQQALDRFVAVTSQETQLEIKGGRGSSRVRIE